ncbi:hypothetical protein [Wolbachia endosymbiont of Kerria lacca]
MFIPAFIISSQCPLSLIIPVLDTGMALLHHSRKEQAVTDGICYKIDI